MKSLSRKGSSSASWNPGSLFLPSSQIPLGVITRERERRREEQLLQSSLWSLVESCGARSSAEWLTAHDVTLLPEGCGTPLGFIRLRLVISGQCKSTLPFVRKCNCGRNFLFEGTDQSPSVGFGGHLVTMISPQIAPLPPMLTSGNTITESPHFSDGRLLCCHHFHISRILSVIT